MNSQVALSIIIARYRRTVEQLEEEYQGKLVTTGGAVCLSGGPLFENEPSAVAAYIEVRAWRNIKRQQIAEQYAVEVQVWFDCSQ